MLGVLLIYLHSPSGAACPRDCAYISVKPLAAVLQPSNVAAIFIICMFFLNSGGWPFLLSRFFWPLLLSLCYWLVLSRGQYLTVTIAIVMMIKNIPIDLMIIVQKGVILAIVERTELMLTLLLLLSHLELVLSCG